MREGNRQGRKEMPDQVGHDGKEAGMTAMAERFIGLPLTNISLATIGIDLDFDAADPSTPENE